MISKAGTLSLVRCAEERVPNDIHLIALIGISLVR